MAKVKIVCDFDVPGSNWPKIPLTCLRLSFLPHVPSGKFRIEREIITLPFPVIFILFNLSLCSNYSII